jgi:hypothetical protein
LVLLLTGLPVSSVGCCAAAAAPPLPLASAALVPAASLLLPCRERLMHGARGCVGWLVSDELNAKLRWMVLSSCSCKAAVVSSRELGVCMCVPTAASSGRELMA